MTAHWLRHLRGGWLALIVCAAAAAGTCADFLNALAQRESGMNPQAHNPYGYVGLFQMGEAALIDAGYYRPDGTGKNDWRGSWTGVNGINSLEDFKNNPTAQAQAIATYHQRVWSYIKAQGLESYVGQTVGGIEMTQSGMVAAAHLVGSGNLAAFLRSDGLSVPRDGNNTPITEYISRFGGYTITGSGSNCTQFASGHPSGGVTLPVPTPSGPTHPAPGVRVVTDGPAAGTINPDEAYYSVTGHSADQLARTIKLLVVSVVMLAAAGCWLGSWTLFSAGASTWHRFLHDNQRLLVVVLLFLVVLA